jgi:rRNA maturation RNase YbeY
MSISFFAEDVSIPKLEKRKLKVWLKNIIESEGKKLGGISYIFCSDNFLLEVNRKYLNHDYFTDIITFDYVNKDIISGDIFISIDRVKDNAISFNNSFHTEINRMLVHGVLHLLGYKDKTKRDKQVMTFKEDFFINIL